MIDNETNYELANVCDMVHSKVWVVLTVTYFTSSSIMLLVLTSPPIFIESQSE